MNKSFHILVRCQMFCENLSMSFKNNYIKQSLKISYTKIFKDSYASFCFSNHGYFYLKYKTSMR